MGENSEFISAVQIVERLQKAGYDAYFAGGVVRDMLMQHRAIHDIDIATSATPETIKRLFDNVHPVGESFGVMLVVKEGIAFEVATFREDGGYQNGRHPESVTFSSSEVDALRRDFTINGMFYDPLTETVHDYVGGREDLQAGVIRTIRSAEERFREDFLRMLRAIRFAARFDFPIEGKTWIALCDLAHNIGKISVERIFQEVNKMLSGPRASNAVRMMLDSGMLAVILPELSALVGCEQPPQFHPEGDVFEHTLLVLDNMPEDASPEAMWAALLHDIGKPATQTIEDRIRFNTHHSVGAEMSDILLRRLKVSNDFRGKVVSMVQSHMKFIDVQQMKLSTLKRFLARETLDGDLQLHKADCLASNGSLENYHFVIEKRDEFAEAGVAPAPLVVGGDLIKMGVKPSPKFGALLKEVYDLQLEEVLHTKEAALHWLKKRIEKEQIG